MTAWLVVMTLLGQDAPLTPPPPPPAVEPEALTPPPMPPAEGQPPPVPLVTPPDEERYEGGVEDPEGPDAPSKGVRILAATGFAALGAGALTVGWHFVGQCRSGISGGADCFLAGFGVTALGVGGIVAGAFGGHRLFGGKSNLGWTFLGAGAGAAIGLIGFLFGAVIIQPRNVPTFAPVLAAGAVAAVGAAGVLELGHFLMVRELRRGKRVSAAPMLLPSGAGVSFAGTF